MFTHPLLSLFSFSLSPVYESLQPAAARPHPPLCASSTLVTVNVFLRHSSDSVISRRHKAVPNLPLYKPRASCFILHCGIITNIFLRDYCTFLRTRIPYCLSENQHKVGTKEIPCGGKTCRRLWFHITL